MNDRRKVLALGAVLAIALAVAAFVALRSGEGDTNANVADFARSIDRTKADSPSVPPERLALGRAGKGGK